MFADAVRQAQKLSKISDACAHQLAVLAMDQFGHLLHNLNPKLATAASECEIDERTWQHRAIVWLPSQMVLADDTIPQNWDVTSDSLAAWLAQKLNAKHLILLKSDKPNEANLNLKEITDNGLVDFHFSKFVGEQNFSTWLVNKSDYAHFESGSSADSNSYGHLLAKVASAVN